MEYIVVVEHIVVTSVVVAPSCAKAAKKTQKFLMQSIKKARDATINDKQYPDK